MLKSQSQLASHIHKGCVVLFLFNIVHSTHAVLSSCLGEPLIPLGTPSEDLVVSYLLIVPALSSILIEYLGRNPFCSDYKLCIAHSWTDCRCMPQNGLGFVFERPHHGELEHMLFRFHLLHCHRTLLQSNVGKVLYRLQTGIHRSQLNFKCALLQNGFFTYYSS